MSKNLIYAVAGFAVGCVTGGYLVGIWCGNKYRSLLEEKLEDAEEEKREIVEELNEKLKEASKEEKEDTDLDWDDLDDIFEEESNGREGQIEIDYAALSKKYHSDGFNERFADRVGPSEEDYDPDDIYVVDQEEFKREISYRDNETITYYQQDGVLVDSCEKVISNQKRVIGVEGVEEVEKTDEDFVYVSNDVDDKIFEIIVEHTYSYRDMIGG